MRKFPVLIVIVGSAIALTACSSGGGTATYGPPSAQFSAAFPSPPKTIPMPAKSEQGMPPGTKGTLYGVGDVNLGTSAGSPHVPTFGVAVEVVAGADAGSKVSSLMKAFGSFAKSTGGHAVTVGGASGWEIRGSEKAVTGGDNGDAKARAGELIIGRGDVIYIVGAFSDSQSDVDAFVASFKPL
ncbi:MAG: hypothetical protein M0Z69_12685 [Actinomycetota bacterium]|nr:hypothetical protein [Actinomycetota bacterium]